MCICIYIKITYTESHVCMMAILVVVPIYIHRNSHTNDSGKNNKSDPHHHQNKKNSTWAGQLATTAFLPE